MRTTVKPLAIIHVISRGVTLSGFIETPDQGQIEATQSLVRSDDENFRGQSALDLVMQIADLKRRSEQLWAEHLEVYQASFEERAIVAEYRWRSEHQPEEGRTSPQ